MAQDDVPLATLLPLTVDPFATPKPGQVVPPADVGQAARLVPGQALNAAWNASGLKDVYDAIRQGGAWPEIVGAAIPGAMGALQPEAKGIAAAEEAASPLAKAITAYHGSPYDFDRFDLSKIGTGEGAQAYGHGLYFAENPAVAGSYKVPRMGPDLSLPEQRAEDYLNTLGRDEAVKQLTENATNADRFFGNTAKGDEFRQAAHLLKSGWTRPEPPPPKMYQVSIAADPEHFLHYDLPLNEQHPKVQEAIRNIPGALKKVEQPPMRWVAAGRSVEDANHHYLTDTTNADTKAPMLSYAGISKTSNGYEVQSDAFEKAFPTLEEAKKAAQDYVDQSFKSSAETEGNATGSRILENLSRLKNNYASHTPEASEMLRQAGIPGIKYLDQGSRAGGQGTRNYVVFDDKLISILKKYGMAGLIASGALSQMSRPPLSSLPSLQQ